MRAQRIEGAVRKERLGLTLGFAILPIRRGCIARSGFGCSLLRTLRSNWAEFGRSLQEAARSAAFDGTVSAMVA